MPTTTNTIKYVLVAIGSFLLGWLFFRNKKQVNTDKNFNKTISQNSDGKYFLIFNSVVVLSKQVSKDQYDLFNQQYPQGATSNVLSDFNPNINKYTIEDGKYYEYVWDGNTYGQRTLITKQEYDYETSSKASTQYMKI